jgi:probable rRNA maturation factor
LEINVYNDAGSAEVPDTNSIRACVEAVLTRSGKDRDEVAVRFVEEIEMKEINLRYRGKDASTNVLSFEFEDPPEVATQILGDIIICPDVVHREASEQGKRSGAHYAHLIVHGALHLCGYDHEEERQASEMEQLEVEILEALGYENPY